MKILSTIFFIVFTTVVQAQFFQKPNYPEIEKLISKQDENNYLILLKRLQSNDTTLTDDQYYILYYGQSLQNFYNPYHINNQYLFNLLKNNEEDEFTKQSIEYLKSNPFDLQIRDYLVMVLNKNGDKNLYKSYLRPLKGFITAMLKSGNGTSKDKAIHTMSVPDEYVFMKILRLKKIAQKLDPPCDVFELADNDLKLSQIYFDITQPLSKIKSIF